MAYDTIQDEGVALTQRTRLNFIGAGISATDDSPNTRTNVSLVDPVAVKTAAYTLTASDSVILGDANSAGFTLTLPSAVGISGRRYTIKKIDKTKNIVTIATTSAQKIDTTLTTYPLDIQNRSVIVESDGANWKKLAITGLPSVKIASEYGAVGDGVADDRNALQDMFNSAVSGDIFYLPGRYRITAGLTLGNGTSSAVSSVNAISVIGRGTGSSAHQQQPIDNGTLIAWDGSAGGTMLTVNGPIHGVLLDGIAFDCKAVTNAAATAVALVHSWLSVFRRLHARRYNGYAYTITAYATHQGAIVLGAGLNLWETVMASEPNQVTAGGIQIGAASGGISTFDVHGNTWVGCHFRCGSNGAAIELRYMDSSSFVQCTTAGGIGVLVSPPSGNTNFPTQVAFFGCHIQGGVSGTGWTGTDPLIFLPYNVGDGEPVPTPSQPYAAGVTGRGQWFGRFTQQPLFYSSITDSQTITGTTTETAFNRSFTIPANALGAVGTVVRVMATGRYTGVGAPNLTFRFRIGGTNWSDVIFIAVPADTNRGWSAWATLTIRAVGAGGSYERGTNMFGLGGHIVVPSATQGVVSINTTSALTVDLTATWSIANASATTLHALTVEIMYPSATQ